MRYFFFCEQFNQKCSRDYSGLSSFFPSVYCVEMCRISCKYMLAAFNAFMLYMLFQPPVTSTGSVISHSRVVSAYVKQNRNPQLISSAYRGLWPHFYRMLLHSSLKNLHFISLHQSIASKISACQFVHHSFGHRIITRIPKLFYHSDQYQVFSAHFCNYSTFPYRFAMDSHSKATLDDGSTGVAFNPIVSNDSREPDSSPKYALIFLHGLGDTCDNWASTLVHSLSNSPFHHNTRYIFPEAPIQPVSLNAGMSMPAWADILTIDPNYSEDEGGYTKSAERINNLVESEVEKRGVSPKHIVLGGFSQGAAVAYLAWMTCKYQLGGVCALSGWLPLRKTEKVLRMLQNLKSSKCESRILHCHGEVDPIVPCKWGEESVRIVKDYVHNPVVFKTYKDLGHAETIEELEDVRSFVIGVFGRI